MDVPWARLRVPRFCAVCGDDRHLSDVGARSADEPANDTIPWVIYGDVAVPSSEVAFDAKLLARVLHPTLPDHEFTTICELHDIPLRADEPARALGELFGLLIQEVMRLDRAVVGLLARLLPEPLSGLLSRALVLPPAPSAQTERAEAAEPIEPQEQRGGEPSSGDPLGPAGFVARSLPAYEQRDGQVAMARGVERVLRDGGALVVEAGPGTGKTFAYLIPAIGHLARERSSRIIISTRTKQLQEQLFAKDLPFLLAEMGSKSKVALLKGRENYLCLRRWEIAVRELSEGLERDRLHLLAPLARWLWETETGDIDENVAFLAHASARELWRRLCDSHLHCIDSVCPHVDECFSIRARRRARKADLLIVNHSLLLNDLTVDRLVLGKYTHAIIDEAHALEETARSAFTLSLSLRVVERLADELTPSRRRRVGWLRRLPEAREDIDVRAATDLVAALRTGASRLFAGLERKLPDERRGPLPSFADYVTTFDRLATRAEQLQMAIEELIDKIDDPELEREGEAYVGSIRELGYLLRLLVAPPEADAVHWYERDRYGLSLHVTPLEVAPILTRALYPPLEAVVLTSATLSVDGDFDFVVRALGLDAAFDEVDTEVVASPFSYREHMRICIPSWLPSVTEDGERYADELAAFLGRLAGRLGRKGLVLFTSHSLLGEVRRRLPDEIEALSQGVDGPRSKLIERFRRFQGGILLLGTDSFWEGVDFPGDELEYVVITRLPFAVPTDPIQAALGDHYARIGRDPFLDLALPRAVLKLRQGVGRLIRTRRDRGAVILTDRRILVKGYGRSFAAALPASLEAFSSPGALVEDVAGWFGDARQSGLPPIVAN
ncbi:MAG: helicase C-terminal domain-containing protein [Candidatus Bipolaricaulia bacterium]